MGTRLRALVCMLALLVATASPVAAKPGRIVSLNLCTDELALRLAGPERVASVTWLSRDPRISNVADLAAGVPVNRGLAEEIAALDPDLVLAGAYTTRDTVALLKRLGMPVMEIGAPTSIAEVRDQIREVARALGAPERGTAMIARMDRRLAAIPPSRGPGRPSAIVFQPNGFTTGRGSLVDDIMTEAGLKNLAAEMALESYGRLPLEQLVMARPDMLIMNREADAAPALAYDVLRHPVLRDLPVRTISLPARLWTCAGPEVVEAVARLAAAARRVCGRACAP